MTRRGVSQIIGSLFMLAVVAALGSVLLFTGIENITDFNTFLQIAGTQDLEFLNEDFIIEHVYFDPNDPSAGAGKNVTLWIRNTGTVDITLERITIHKIDSQQQELLIYDEVPDLSIFVDEIQKKSYSDSTDPGWLPTDPSSDTIQELGTDEQYRLSVTTSRGNSVEMVVKPFHT